MKSPLKSIVTRSLVSSVMILALNACNSHGVKTAASGANQSIGDGSQKDQILSERAGAYSNTDLSLSMGKNGLLEIIHLSGPSAAALFTDLGILAQEGTPITVGKITYNVRAKVGAGTECRELSDQNTASKLEKIYDCRVGYTPKTGIVGRITPPYAGDKVMVDAKEVSKDPAFKGSAKGAMTSNLVIKKGDTKALIVINEASGVYSKMDGVEAVALKTPAKKDGKSEQKLAPHVTINQDAMKDSMEPTITAGIQISLVDGTAILNEGTKAEGSPVEDSEADAGESAAKSDGSALVDAPVVKIVFESLERTADKKSLKLTYQVTGVDGKTSIGTKVDVNGKFSDGAQACMTNEALDLDPTKTSMILSINEDGTPTELNLNGLDAGMTCIYESKIDGVQITSDACTPVPQAL